MAQSSQRFEPPRKPGRFKAIAEQLVAQALTRLEGADPASDQACPTQAHDLIRSPQEYGELFAMAAACTTPCTTTDPTLEGDLFA